MNCVSGAVALTENPETDARIIELETVVRPMYYISDYNQFSCDIVSEEMHTLGSRPLPEAAQAPLLRSLACLLGVQRMS